VALKELGRLSWLLPVAVATLATAPASAAQLTLTWVDNSANEAGFSIERRAGSAGPFGEIGLVAADVTTYGDGSVTPGLSYCYRVRARNTAGDSAPTNEACGLAVTFRDVPGSYWAWRYVEALAALGVTAGCGAGNYCPDGSITRAEMAVFLLKAKLGAGYVPAAPTGDEFDDVPAGHWAAAWIEALVAEGITAGCGAGNYCPGNPVTRAQMAVFLLRTKYGPGYQPPTATGTAFADVSAGHWAAAWIEALVAEGITAGCGAGNYCPESAVTRAQMAVFLVKTLGLPLPF
jgi:hypothetical protein